MTARHIAADVLHGVRSRNGFAAELIEAAASSLTPQDRRLATQLVYGVIRRQATLDALIAPFVTRPRENVEPRLWDLLQLGAYQIAFLTQVPRHAAVHETVELAPYVGSATAKGFLNGVLRRVSEVISDDFTDEPAMNAMPFEDYNYRRLNKPLLPDPRGYPAAYISEAFSWPGWLADRWFDRHGFDECVRLGFHFNAPPPLWLRVNARMSSRAAYLARLAAEDIVAEPGEHPYSLRLRDGHSVRTLPGYAHGAFAVQDHSSMLVAAALAPEPGMRVLDLCSAPGGKTTHLAEMMDDRGTIVACDVDARRLDTVITLGRRMGLRCVEPRLVRDDGTPPPGPFDAALVDAPCSNTGVLGRRPEVRWRLKPGEIEHLIRLQTRLLTSAVGRVRPGGAVVYSTCSIEPEENRGVVNAVCRLVPGLTLEADAVAIPGRPSDGGYWARLRVAGGDRIIEVNGRTP